MNKTQKAAKINQNQERKIMECLLIAVVCFVVNLIVIITVDSYLLNQASKQGLFVAGIPPERFSIFGTPWPLVSSGAIILFACGTIYRLYAQKNKN